MSQVLIKNLVRQLSELQNGSRWFDQCFNQKLDHLTNKEAFKNPIPEVHSVAEHVSHIIEWRKECLLRFKGERTDLMNSPDDWKSTKELNKIGWENLKYLLYVSTDQLIKAIESKDDTYLDTKFQDEEYNFHYIIDGIIQHDLYHLGQIGVTIKLLGIY